EHASHHRGFLTLSSGQRASSMRSSSALWLTFGGTCDSAYAMTALSMLVNTCSFMCSRSTAVTTVLFLTDTTNAVSSRRPSEARDDRLRDSHHLTSVMSDGETSSLPTRTVIFPSCMVTPETWPEPLVPVSPSTQSTVWPMSETPCETCDAALICVSVDAMFDA